MKIMRKQMQHYWQIEVKQKNAMKQSLAFNQVNRVLQ